MWQLVQEIRQNRELIWALAMKELHVRYKRSALGTRLIRSAALVKKSCFQSTPKIAASRASTNVRIGSPKALASD